MNDSKSLGQLTLAAIQYDIVWENPDANFQNLLPLLEDAVGQGAQLICLPEMFSWGFSMATKKIAEPADGPSASWLIQSAKDLGVWICGSYPEASDTSPAAYNQLLLASPSGETFKYAKMHPFSYSGEDKYYKAGDQTLSTKVGELNLSFFVCYDLRFGNQFWPLAPSTDLYVVPANWPKSRREHWLALLKARAIENQAFVIGINRVGVDGNGIQYSGDSVVFGPQGELLGQAGDSAEVLVVEIDAAEITKTRDKFPFLKDRR